MKQLSSAIDAAAPFLSLTTEVEAARTVLASCLKRVMAAERLEATIDTVRRQVAALTAADCEQLQEAAAEAAAEAASGKQAPSSKQQINGTSNGSATPGSSGPSTPTAAAASSSKWDALSRQLDSAVEEARDANVGVSKAKRLLKELQAAAQAVEACRQLDATLSKRPCGSAALRGALAKAEAAAAAMSGIPESGALAEAFLARIQSGRKRLEVERAGEALHKVRGCRRSWPGLAWIAGCWWRMHEHAALLQMCRCWQDNSGCADPSRVQRAKKHGYRGDLRITL